MNKQEVVEKARSQIWSDHVDFLTTIGKAPQESREVFFGKQYNQMRVARRALWIWEEEVIGRVASVPEGAILLREFESIEEWEMCQRYADIVGSEEGR